jgi:hypothetical protein
MRASFGNGAGEGFGDGRCARMIKSDVSVVILCHKSRRLVMSVSKRRRGRLSRHAEPIGMVGGDFDMAFPGGGASLAGYNRPPAASVADSRRAIRWRAAGRFKEKSTAV